MTVVKTKRTGIYGYTPGDPRSVSVTAKVAPPGYSWWSNPHLAHPTRWGCVRDNHESRTPGASSDAHHERYHQGAPR